MKQFFGLIVVLLLLLAPGIVWFGCRIEPGNGEIAVLIRKTGKPLPPGEAIARESGQKGIQLDVLGEGRYFRNPYVWDWRIVPVTDVPAGKFAVLVRKYGKDLDAGGKRAPGVHQGQWARSAEEADAFYGRDGEGRV